MGKVPSRDFEAWPRPGTTSQDIWTSAAQILAIYLSFMSPQTFWKCDAKLLVHPFILQFEDNSPKALFIIEVIK